MELNGEILEEIEELAMAGVSDRTICDNLGMDYETWEEDIETDEILRSTIETGRRRGIERVTKALYIEAIEGDVGAAKFYLLNKDRDNWIDVKHSKVALSADDGSEETAKMFADVIENKSKKGKK
jgi:hypothetical protein